MADLGVHGNARPIPAALLQRRAHHDVQFDVHGAIFAKYCDKRKQHLASAAAYPLRMAAKPVNQVLAESLKSFMGDKWTNVALAKEAGVGEGTIRNYLDPDKRLAGASGKAPSAKLVEVDMLARALGVTVADLVTDATEEQRRERHRAHAAAFYQMHGHLPTWAPDALPAAKAVRPEPAFQVSPGQKAA